MSRTIRRLSRRAVVVAAVVASIVAGVPAWASPESESAEEGVELTDLSLEELMLVNVTTASKKEESAFEAPGVITVVGAEEIRRSGARTLEGILNRVTSMHLYSSYMFPRNRMTLRGDLAGQYDNHILLLINGRPFRDSMLGGMNSAFYQAFPVSSIERIEIVRGPGSVLYGSNAFVGVVNVITRKGKEQGTAGTVGGGSWDTLYADLSFGVESEDAKLKASAAGTYHQERGFQYTAFDEAIGPLPSNLDSDYQGSQSAGGYVNLTWDEVTLDAFLSFAANDNLGVLPIWPMQQLLQPNRHFVDLGWSHTFLDQITVATNATYNYSEWNFVVDDPGPANPLVNTGAHDLLVELSGTWSPHESFNATTGVWADYKRGQQEAINAATPDIPPFSELWWSGYLQADYTFLHVDWPFLHQAKLMAGFQWHKPEDKNVEFVPRAGLILSLTDRIDVKGLYGEAFRAPLPGETDLDAGAILQGNPNLQSEKARTVDVELLYHDDRMKASAVYFFSKQRNLIERFNPGTGVQFFNIGSISYHGVELDLKYAITANWFLRSSYTYQWNQDQLGNTNATLVSNHMFKIGASYASPRGFLIGAFYGMLSQPAQLAVPVVNPIPQTWNLLEVNAELDVNALLGTNIPLSPLIKVRGTNLADTDMNFPEWVRRNLNSLPQGGGAAGFADLTLRY